MVIIYGVPIFRLFTVLNFCLVLLCSAADTDYMKRSIKRYFSKIRHHSTGLETKKEAKEYIHDEFQRLGLTTTYHSFWNDRDTDKKVRKYCKI